MHSFAFSSSYLITIGKGDKGGHRFRPINGTEENACRGFVRIERLLDDRRRPQIERVLRRWMRERSVRGQRVLHAVGRRRRRRGRERMVEGRRHRVLPMKVMLMMIGANQIAGFFE